MNFPKVKQPPSQRNTLFSMQTWAIFFSLSAASVLFGMGSAHAQSTQGVPAPEPAASATSASQTPAPAPRYTASNLERAFNFMDANHDGQVSREEAAGFRGVARHFDQADTNHDGFLSREEFDAAMNYVKPQ